MLSMERLFLSLFTLSFVFGTPSSAFADISGLIPCRDSSTFQRRLDSSVAKLTARLTNYEEGTPAYLALQDQIDRTKLRFDKYGKQGLLCGAEGLPHLIADGRASHAGEFILPAILFLYITGYIGWSGRSYQQYTKTTDKPNENEIIINVPAALFTWDTISAVIAFNYGAFTYCGVVFQLLHLAVPTDIF